METFRSNQVFMNELEYSSTVPEQIINENTEGNNKKSKLPLEIDDSFRALFLDKTV